MTTTEIANRLYELCSQGQSATAQEELYADDVTSTEKDMQGQLQTVKGKDGLKEKSRQFNEMIEEMHGGSIEKPAVFGNTIFMEMAMDATMKGMGRMNMREMCVYEVKDEKIISERFYY